MGGALGVQASRVRLFLRASGAEVNYDQPLDSLTHGNDIEAVFGEDDVEDMLQAIEALQPGNGLVVALRDACQNARADAPYDCTWGETTEFAEALRMIKRLLTPEQRRGGSSDSNDEASEILEVVQEVLNEVGASPVDMLSKLQDEFGD